MGTLSPIWLRRVGLAALLALGLGYVPYHLYGSSGLTRYWRLKEERDRLHAANRAAYEANLKLRAEIEALSDDQGNLSRGAVERVARDELQLIAPGERVYRVVDRGAAAPGAGGVR